MTAPPDRTLLIVGDTLRCLELRHEVQLALFYPSLYIEHESRQHLFVDSLELANAGPQARAFQEFGFDDIAGAQGTRAALLEAVAAVCQELQIDEAVVPHEFPLDVAERLRAANITVRPDGALFARRRRRKTGTELDGIRRAQRAAEHAMTSVRDALANGERSCEQLKLIASHAMLERGATAEAMVVAHGAQTAEPINVGSGELQPGEPVIVDLFPRDIESRCFADMTRTFYIGSPPAQLLTYHALCNEAREHLLDRVRAGADTRTLARGACDLFASRGIPTFLDRESSSESGVIHVLGHGVGLQMIEEPELWLTSDQLVEGDVISIEPGIYSPGWGGCRIEDLVLVTASGVELLTDFDYDLAVDS